MTHIQSSRMIKDTSSNVSTCIFCSIHHKYSDPNPHDFFTCQASYNVLANFYHSTELQMLEVIAMEKAQRDITNDQVVWDFVKREIMKQPRVVLLEGISHKGNCADITFRDYLCLVWDDALGVRNKYGLPVAIVVDTSSWTFIHGTVDLIEKFRNEIIKKSYTCMGDRVKPYWIEFGDNPIVEGTEIYLGCLV